MSSFREFLQYFAILEPPLILTEESILAFSKNNKPIPEAIINRIFPDLDPEFDADEDVEYIPCFQIAVSAEFYTLVYLRTALLRYEFYLLTLDKNGEKIDQKLIAGLISDNENVVQMAASFDENACVHIAGARSGGEVDSDFGKNIKAVELEILEDGYFQMMEE